MKASTGSDHPHMVLQDLTSGHVNPSVMDIKIGSRTWGLKASEAYFAKCLKKDRESTSIPLGFRISGLQVYVDDESGFYKPDRNYIRKTGPNDVRLLLRSFGLALKGAWSNAEVKLIDFAHVTDGNGVIDHNFLGGLCSLIKFISDILAETKDYGSNDQVEL
ncbi:hypothetical protein L1987_45075 [Smallanthus sonchifolius]|uniref:Uncharacterized protein n=1 Tax=Smallanthus sonchifolius TaxID=185202 RepID=A0ACB9GQN1_9ASTR|nr:hypothetical protein L1987_45075 [Smallanthus sonchifolius]